MLLYNGQGQEGIPFPGLIFASTLTCKGHRQTPPLGFSRKLRVLPVCEIDRAAETKYPRPRDLNNTDLVSHPWGGWESKVKVLAELVLPKRGYGRIHSGPACLLALKMDGFFLYLHCPHHYRSMSQFPLLIMLNEGPL